MKTLYLFFTALLTVFTAGAQHTPTAPTTQPILRLNTDMHTANIPQLSCDQKGKFILTCSIDKTAKLWDVNTGKLIRTFRHPIDPGHEGVLYACALSPDANTVAVAGYTGPSWFNEGEIYVFNAHTGEMIRRLSGMMVGIIKHLEFSYNGQYLAAAAESGDRGIFVFNTATWNLEKKMTGYTADPVDITFDTLGRIASISTDGMIRIYSASFEQIENTKQDMSDELKAVHIAFSPDGSKLAVGYAGSPRLKVLDGNDLTLLFNPDITDVKATLNTVTFSNDGQYLYAAGDYTKLDDKKVVAGLAEGPKNWKQIRRWDKAGKGRYVDYSSCFGTITEMKQMFDTTVIYASVTPEFGRISMNGNITFYDSCENYNFFTGNNSHLRLNHDGSLVGFAAWKAKPLSFSLSDKDLSVKQCLEPGFTDSVGTITVKGWKLNKPNSLKLNGNPVSWLGSKEIPRSVDISPVAKYIVLGTDLNIRCLDSTGTSKWTAQVQVPAWAVKISGDEKVAVATMGDGTIEWYNMSNGKKILSLFVHPDEKRWVLWTPSGYYACAAGAENLIGWHVNNGADKEAAYYPFSKFRDVYYRPDVINMILKTWNEAEALKLAYEASISRVQGGTTIKQDSINENKANLRYKQDIEGYSGTGTIKQILPPTINISSPFNGTGVTSPTLTLKFGVESPNNKPLLSFRILIDGTLTRDTVLSREQVENGKITITIPPRNCRVSLMARNEFGFSEPAEIELIWKGAVAELVKPKPNLYILAVGISNYDKPGLQLKMAAKDATDFCAVMEKQKGLLYSDVVVKLLTDKAAVRDSIVVGLDWLKESTTANDIAIIFLAGHGMNDNWNTFYFLAVGSDPQKISTTGLMYASIQNTVAKLHGTKLVFADACHSGNIMAGWAAPDINGFINGLTTAEKGAIVFTSSAGNQTSLENPEWGNGAFTKALLEGIGGGGGEVNTFNTSGQIKIKALDSYISERVSELTNGQQTPTTIFPGTVVANFPIAILKK